MDNRIFWIAPLVVMGIGILPLPYGYYTLLKLIVLGCFKGYFTLECNVVNDKLIYKLIKLNWIE